MFVRVRVRVYKYIEEVGVREREKLTDGQRNRQMQNDREEKQRQYILNTFRHTTDRVQFVVLHRLSFL